MKKVHHPVDIGLSLFKCIFTCVFYITLNLNRIEKMEHLKAIVKSPCRDLHQTLNKHNKSKALRDEIPTHYHRNSTIPSSDRQTNMMELTAAETQDDAEPEPSEPLIPDYKGLLKSIISNISETE